MQPEEQRDFPELNVDDVMKNCPLSKSVIVLRLRWLPVQMEA